MISICEKCKKEFDRHKTRDWNTCPYCNPPEEHPKKGNKFDNDKPDLSLIPREPLWELARVLMQGEKKYGRFNWQGGIDTHRLTAAAMRHITQFNDGELLDEETKTSHLMNACANLFFAFWMLQNKPEHHTIPKKE